MSALYIYLYYVANKLILFDIKLGILPDFQGILPDFYKKCKQKFHNEFCQ